MNFPPDGFILPGDVKDLPSPSEGRGGRDNAKVPVHLHYLEDVVEILSKGRNRIRKVMTAFCKSRGLDASLVRFFQDGKRIRGAERVEDLDREDDGVVDVDVATEQEGG